jgi:putative DNA primase/helicase
MTAAERVEYRNRLKRIRQQRDAELQQRQQQTAEYAARLWSAAKSADLSHPYLSRKCISVHHLRQSQGLLLVPLIDVHSKLWNLQRIAPDGTKRFLARGRVKGCFTLFGELNTGPLHICEGMATGATIHQQTGMPTACAMNAGNLLAVCSALSQEESQEESQVIVCADNDHRTLGNPGITKGSEAAASIGAGLTWPAHCGPACLCTDFNDITHCGHAQEAAA